MNDLSLERTTQALAAFNSINETVSDQREEDTDRAFKMTMMQFQMDAEAKRQEHEMLLGAHLTAMKDLAQKRYELNNQNMMLGGIVKGLDSEGGQNAVNMVLGNISQQSEYINDEDDFHANAIGEIQQASLKLQDDINTLQAGMSEYFKGYNDTAAAHKAMNEFATSEGETGMAKYTVNNEELGRLSEALGFKPDSPEAKGVAAFANNVLSGQYADFYFKEGELGTKKTSAEADMIRALAAKKEADAVAAHALSPAQVEQNRILAEWRTKGKGAGFDEWLGSNPDVKKRYEEGVLGIAAPNADLGTDAMADLMKAVGGRLQAAGIDPTSDEGTVEQTKLIRATISKNSKKYGYENEDDFRATIKSTSSGIPHGAEVRAAYEINNDAGPESWDPRTNALLKDVKQAASDPAKLEKLEKKYPGIKAELKKAADDLWNTEYTKDTSKIFIEAAKAWAKTNFSVSKTPRKGTRGWGGNMPGPVRGPGGEYR